MSHIVLALGPTLRIENEFQRTSVSNWHIEICVSVSLSLLSVSVFVSFSVSLSLRAFGSRGSMVAKLKLNGIDGRAPPGVESVA